MCGGRIRRVALWCAAAVLFPVVVEGQHSRSIIQLQSVDGEAGASFDGTSSWWPSNGQRTTAWREWVDVVLSGSVVHPDLLQYTLRARPVLSQGRVVNQIDSLSSGMRGNRLSGGGQLYFFRGFEVNGSVAAERVDAYQRLPFGGWDEGQFTRFEARLKDNNPLLPAELTFERRLRDRVWYQGGPELRTNDDVRTLRFFAQNSKTTILVEDLARVARDTGYREDQLLGHLRHAARWGKGSSLYSSLRYSDRTLGGRRLRSIDWSEAASLQQTEALSTTLRTAIGSQRGSSGRARSVEAGAGLRFAPGVRFGAGLDGLVRRTSYEMFSRDLARVGPSANFSFKTPFESTLSGSMDAMYEWRADGYSSGIWADVIQEPHTVAPGGVLRLERPLADPRSVVVSDRAGGEVYQEGIDYRLLSDGVFLEVHVLPSGRLAEGDELWVDYRYRLEPDATVNGISYGYGLTLRRRQWSLYARRRGQAALGESLPGTTTSFRNLDRSTVGLMMDIPVGRGVAALLAERSVDRIDLSRATVYSLRASLSLPVTTTITSATGVGYHRGASIRGGGLERVQIEQSVTSQLGRRLRARGVVSHYRWREFGYRERFLGAGAQLEWTRGAVDVRVTYDWGYWRRTYDNREQRLLIDFSRSF